MPTKPVNERFWQKVEKSTPHLCWLWKGMRDSCGYGLFTIHWKRHIASRVSWELHKGSIPAGLFVLHRCDNPPCVNPSHLFLGTNKDNTNDMVVKGRQSRLSGSSNGRSKLSDSAVVSIRKIAATGIPQTEIAASFNVSKQTVNHIVKGRRWTHLK